MAVHSAGGVLDANKKETPYSIHLASLLICVAGVLHRIRVVEAKKANDLCTLH